MITIGCDIGKTSLAVYLNGKHYKYENKKDGIEKFISQCQKHTVERIMLEPTEI